MGKLTGVTKHQLEIISAAAISEYQKENKREKKQIEDNRLFNTRLVIYNYRELKIHCNTIPKQVIEFEDSIFDEEKLTLETLMKERAKTYAMMEYIDLMWNAYEQHAKTRDELYQRRFNIINNLFVADSPLTVAELSERHHISVPLIYKDRNKGISNFSVFLFGMKVLSFKGS